MAQAMGSYCVSGSFSGLRASAVAALTADSKSTANPIRAISRRGQRPGVIDLLRWRPVSSWGRASSVAREGPDVGDIGHLVGVAVDHRTVLGARHRDELGPEAHRELRGLAALLGGGEVGAVDGDEAGLDRLALLLALFDRVLEAIIDLFASRLLSCLRSPAA